MKKSTFNTLLVGGGFLLGTAGIKLLTSAPVKNACVQGIACGMRVKNCYQDMVEQAKANPAIPSVDVVIRAGRIRETLKDEMLDVIQPDLVLCGARGLSSIKYALLGSISTFLLRNTDCDILVVK